ncbi:hypothetical protein [Methylorubrum aminovorans]
MSERGVFAVDRGIWSDPDFADEKFSEREAFLWLVGEAAWRPVRVRVGSATVDLARGQCAFSTRFMAEKWRWSEARVRRYLGRLREAGIIDAAADARATHITICKYDRFQRVSLPSDAGNDGNATHPRRTSDAPATRQRRKEEDRENISSSLRSEVGTRDRRRPQVPVDPNWQLSAELVATAENCGLTAEQAAAEWPRFIDHALRDDVRHRDWVAAWRTWCRSPYRRSETSRPPPAGGTRGNGLSHIGERKAQGDVSIYRDPFAHLDRPRAGRAAATDDDRRAGPAGDSEGLDEAERGRLVDFDRMRAVAGRA